MKRSIKPHKHLVILLHTARPLQAKCPDSPESTQGWTASFQDTWIVADEPYGGTLQCFCVVSGPFDSHVKDFG